MASHVVRCQTYLGIIVYNILFIAEGGSRSFHHLMLGPSRSSKKWRKLQEVAEARSSRREKKKRRRKEFSQNVPKKIPNIYIYINTHTVFLNNTKTNTKNNDTISKHPQMFTFKMTVVSRYSTWDPNRASATFSMAEMVAEAHLACTTTNALLDPKPFSLENLHLWYV